MFTSQKLYWETNNRLNHTFDSFPYENAFEEFEEEKKLRQEEEERLELQHANSKRRRLARFLTTSRSTIRQKLNMSSDFILDRMPITGHKRALERQSYPTTNIIELPEELVVHIVGFLDHSDIFNVMLVCRSWYHLSCEDFLWRLLYQNYFVCEPNRELFDANERKPVDMEWHQLFTRTYVTEQRWASDVCTTSVLRGHNGTVWTLQNDTQAGLVYTGSYDKTAKVWDAKTRRCLYTLRGHSYPVQCLDVANGFMVTGSLDNSLRLWNLSKQTCQGVVSTRAHNFDVFCLQLMRGSQGDGRTLISGSSDSTVKLWSLSSLMDDAETLDERVYQSQLYYEERRSHYNDPSEPMTPEAMAAEDAQKRRYSNLENQMPLHTFKHDSCVTCLQCDSDGKLLTGGSDKVVRMWDLNKMQETGMLVGHNEGIRCMQWDGNVVVTGSNDCTIKLWDMRLNRQNSCYRTYRANGSIRCLQWHETSLITASNDQTIRYWNMNNDKSEDLFLSQSSVSCLSFTDNTLMCGSSDSLVQILKFV